MSIVLERLNKVQADISQRNNNPNPSTKIIAVTKTFELDHVKPLINHGHIHFGENKLQEATNKWKETKKLNAKIKKHILLSLIHI